jgi:hypothetical protein
LPPTSSILLKSTITECAPASTIISERNAKSAERPFRHAPP